MRVNVSIMTLPIKPPFAPMEALLVSEIPEGDNWEYEPKWDGFRCLAFRDGQSIELQRHDGNVTTHISEPGAVATGP